MKTITIRGVDYNVPDRVEILIRKVNYKETMYNLLETILPSDNYKQGKILETTLLAAMIDGSEYTNNAMKWGSLLTSKVYGLGLVPFEVASKLLKLDIDIPWDKIDDKLERKVINEVDLKLLFGLLVKEDTPDAQKKVQAKITNVLSVLLSDEYEKKSIDRVIVNVLSSLSPEESKTINDIILGIFDRKAFGDTTTPANSEAFTNLVAAITQETDELVRILIQSIINDDKYIEPSDKMLYVNMVVNYNEEDRQLLKEYFSEREEGRNKQGLAKDYIAHFFSKVGCQIGGNISRALAKRNVAAKVDGVL